MKYLNTLWLLSLPILFACSPQPDAQSIIDKSIAAHGGGQLDHASLSFDFRKRHYELTIDNGNFRYQSFFEDSTGQVQDELTNKGYRRQLNGQWLSLSAEDSIKYMNSLNSVVYFALLPYFLNDPAANKKLLGKTRIQGEPYYELEVTFDQQGGGTDYEDEFVYWIHQQAHTMDYLAYSFYVNGGGTRFREAYNERDLNGIRLADYVNYESTVEDFALEDYETLFEEGKVKELSRIDLENVKVSKEISDEV